MVMSDSPYLAPATIRPAAVATYACCVGGIALIVGGLHYLTWRWHHSLSDQAYAFLLALLLVGCVRFFVSMLTIVNFWSGSEAPTAFVVTRQHSRALQSIPHGLVRSWHWLGLRHMRGRQLRQRLLHRHPQPANHQGGTSHHKSPAATKAAGATRQGQQPDLAQNHWLAFGLYLLLCSK